MSDSPTLEIAMRLSYTCYRKFELKKQQENG